MFLSPNHTFASPSGHSWCGKPCCFLKMRHKHCSSILTCLVCISQLRCLAGVRERRNPALHGGNFIPSRTCEHLTPSRGRRYCGDGLLLIHFWFADKSQLGSGRAAGKRPLHSLLSHIPEVHPPLALLFCPSLPSPFEAQLLKLPPALVHLCTSSTKLLILGSLLSTQRLKETALF